MKIPVILAMMDFGTRSTNVCVVPAYGRKYKSEGEAISDWHKGKDFRIINGAYCSERDLPLMRQMGFKTVSIIWDKASNPIVYPIVKGC